MNPAVLFLRPASFKKQLWLVFGVIGGLCALPMIALASVTDVTAIVNPNVSLYTGSAPTVDTYDFGYCTYWASKRRAEIGKAIPNNWGNANTWDDNARAAGYVVDHSPGQGSIMQTDAGPLGHVAFVEIVGADGSWTISEMNFRGWDEVDSRTLPAVAAFQYNFIH